MHATPSAVAWTGSQIASVPGEGLPAFDVYLRVASLPRDPAGAVHPADAGGVVALTGGCTAHWAGGGTVRRAEGGFQEVESYLVHFVSSVI